jgi:Glycosyl transferases group 1
MCGLTGFLETRPEHLSKSEARVRAILETPRRRGPDGQGIWVDTSGAVIGLRRLAIIDLSELGHQPNGLLEAPALGLPEVVTSVPGILDAIEGDHQAVLVSADDPMAVAQGLLDLAADPERRADAFDVVRRTSRIEAGCRRPLEEPRTSRLVPGREEA